MRGTDFLLGGNAEERTIASSAFPQPARRGQGETNGEKTQYSKARDGSI